MHGHPSYSSDAGVLREDVCDHLRRGIRVDQALRSFGRSFSDSTGSAAEFGLSCLTDRLDDFISHDWQTGRWMKFTALCMVYNGYMAAILSCAVAVIVCIVRIRWEDGGRVPWCPLASMATSCCVLLFGQRMRWLACRRSHQVFVDKICINQLNDVEKAEGICSIAGFMRSSDHLVVLWSSRYFTRLWCVYEIATWLHIGKDLHRSMTFMPVSLAACLVSAHIAVFVASMLFYIVTAVPLDVPFMLPVLIVIVVLPGLSYIMRRSFRDLLRLPSQLEAFRIHSAECFCCTVGHIHPKTQKPISCDRLMVYRTLRARYEHQQQRLTTAEEHLESFDAAVQSQFKDAVAAAFGTTRLNYRHALFSSTPAVWLGAEMLVDPLHRSTTLLACRYALLYLCFFAFALPSIARITFYLTMVSLRCCEAVTAHMEAAVVLVTGLSVPVIFAIVWGPYGYAFVAESFVPQLGLSVAHALLAFVCFNDVLKPCLWLMQGAKEAVAFMRGDHILQLTKSVAACGRISSSNDVEDRSGEMEVDEASQHGQGSLPVLGRRFCGANFQPNDEADRCRLGRDGAAEPPAAGKCPPQYASCDRPTVTL